MTSFCHSQQRIPALTEVEDAGVEVHVLIAFSKGAGHVHGSPDANIVLDHDLGLLLELAAQVVPVLPYFDLYDRRVLTLQRMFAPHCRELEVWNRLIVGLSFGFGFLRGCRSRLWNTREGAFVQVLRHKVRHVPRCAIRELHDHLPVLHMRRLRDVHAFRQLLASLAEHVGPPHITHGMLAVRLQGHGLELVGGLDWCCSIRFALLHLLRRLFAGLILVPPGLAIVLLLSLLVTITITVVHNLVGGRLLALLRCLRSLGRRRRLLHLLLMLAIVEARGSRQLCRGRRRIAWDANDIRAGLKADSLLQASRVKSRVSTDPEQRSFVSIMKDSGTNC